jgi:two-component system, OmpR family, KDP operon response regulator KdpE
MSDGKRILIVDDEPQIRRVLRAALVGEGYEVWAAQRGEEALEIVRATRIDLMLLDLNLPDMSGTDVCRATRSGFDMAIIILSVRNSEQDKTAALDAGANDYVTKPFDISELLARIRAQLRRQAAKMENIFLCADFIVDFIGRTVSRGNARLLLAPKEYQLLRYFTENRGTPISHRKLLQVIWGPDYGEERTLLQSVILQLRRKIEPDPRRPRHIVTIPCVGYRFDA